MPRIALAALAALYTSTVFPVAAQQGTPCMPTGALVEQLAKKFGEAVSVSGLDSNGNMLSIYSNDGMQTFTLVMTTPDGLSCVVATGTALVIKTPEAPKPGRSS